MRSLSDADIADLVKIIDEEHLDSDGEELHNVVVIDDKGVEGAIHIREQHQDDFCQRWQWRRWASASGVTGTGWSRVTGVRGSSRDKGEKELEDIDEAVPEVANHAELPDVQPQEL